MRATGTGHVQHHTGLSHTRARFRFYAFDQLSGVGEANVFVVYSDDGATTELFHIAVDNNGNWLIDATANSGGSVSVPGTSGFDLLEVDFNTDAGTLDYWVNDDSVGSDNFPPSADAPPTGTIDAGDPATAEAARLGLPDGFGGTLSGQVTFDYYAATSTMAIGSVFRGDANGDGNVNGLDFQGTQLDIAGVLQSGFPDCDLSGLVNGVDFQCVQIAIAGGFGGR